MKFDRFVFTLLFLSSFLLLFNVHQIAAKPRFNAPVCKAVSGFVADSIIADYSYIDSFAMNAPADIGKDSSTVAAYLLAGCKNDMEKARAVFTWIANNIRYDDNAFNSGKPGSLSATAVLKTRRAVCEGYSNLYKAIGQAMGLEVQLIDGYAKAYGYHTGEKFEGSNPNHAWNAVKINGDWILLDVTWGAGGAEGGRGRLVSHKKFTPYWFNVDRYEFLFKHYPEKSQWQLLPLTITLKQYEDMPLVPNGMFTIGFNGHDIFNKAMAKELPKQLPESFPTTHQVKQINFPLSGILNPTNEATFSITSNEDLEMAISNDLKRPPVLMKKEGNTYSATLPLKHGDLHIAIKEKTGRYSDIMLYKIK